MLVARDLGKPLSCSAKTYPILTQFILHLPFPSPYFRLSSLMSLIYTAPEMRSFQNDNESATHSKIFVATLTNPMATSVTQIFTLRHEQCPSSFHVKNWYFSFLGYMHIRAGNLHIIDLGRPTDSCQTIYSTWLSLCLQTSWKYLEDHPWLCAQSFFLSYVRYMFSFLSSVWLLYFSKMIS